jgi:hypothetical protein
MDTTLDNEYVKTIWVIIYGMDGRISVGVKISAAVRI